jgi:flagellar biogenesis protein FliO
MSIPWARVIGATGSVIALVCIGVFVAKKLDSGRLLRGGRYVELLESRAVGRRLQLYLVRVAGRVVLLAQTGATVTRVAEFDQQELPCPEAEGRPVSAGGFTRLLRKLAGAAQ